MVILLKRKVVFCFFIFLERMVLLTDTKERILKNGKGTLEEVVIHLQKYMAKLHFNYRPSETTFDDDFRSKLILTIFEHYDDYDPKKGSLITYFGPFLDRAAAEYNKK